MRLYSAKGRCLRCTQSWDAHNAQGLAAQHEKKSGHKVEVTLVYRSGEVPFARGRKDARLPFDDGL